MQGIESTIEFVLRNADRIKKCVEEKKMDRGGRGDNNVGGSRGSHISDPTAAQAMLRVEPVDYVHCPYGPMINGRRETRYIRMPEMWLQLEYSTRRFYTSSENEKIVEIYKRRYLQGEYGELWEKTCKDLNITRSWYYVVVHDVIRFAELYASGIGLITPFSKV